MSFIVAPLSGYFFSIEVRSVQWNLLHAPLQTSQYRYRINFDNYRTVYSSAQPTMEWNSSPIVFVYETVYPHLLVAKLMTIELYAVEGDTLIAGASVDLLTLATGPSRIVLSAFEGDIHKGRVCMNLVMNEVCQTRAISKRCVVSSLRGPLAGTKYSDLTLRVRKRASDDSFVCSPATWTTDEATFAVPDHLFALESESMLTLIGYRFELFNANDGHPNVACADGVILFKDCLDPAALPSDPSVASCFSARGEEGSLPCPMLHEDSSEVRIIPPQMQGTRLTTERSVTYTLQLRSENQLEVATIKGHILLDRTITFAQMPTGFTIDGVVYGDPIPGFVRPPFLFDEIEVQKSSSSPAAGGRKDNNNSQGSVPLQV